MEASRGAVAWISLPKGSNHRSYFPYGVCLLLELETVHWAIILEDRTFPILKRKLFREASQLETEWGFRRLWKVKLGDRHSSPPLSAEETFQGHR